MLATPSLLKKIHSAKSNITMENGPFEDVCLIKNGNIPLLC